jgi:hypothetical protein
MACRTPSRTGPRSRPAERWTCPSRSPPSTTYYRSIPGRPAIEFWDDTSADLDHADPGWARVRCPDARGLVLDRSGCEAVGGRPLVAVGAGLLGVSCVGLLFGIVHGNRTWPPSWRRAAGAAGALGFVLAGSWALGRPPEVRDGFLVGALGGLLVFGSTWAAARETTPRPEPAQV